MSATIVTAHSEASKLLTNTLAPQLTLRCTSATSATGGSAVLKLSSSTTSPQLPPQYMSAIIAIDPLVASIVLD